MSRNNAAVSSVVMNAAIGSRCTILLKTVDNLKNPVRPSASTGSLKTKSIVTESHASVATSKEYNRALDDGAVLTR